MSEFIAILMGFIFIIVGILAIRLHTLKLKRLRAEGLEVPATIIEIKGSRDYEKAIISYNVMGEQHTVELDYYSNSMKTGDKVIIYVNANNHKDFIYGGKSPIVLCAMFILVGIVVSTLLIFLY